MQIDTNNFEELLKSMQSMNSGDYIDRDDVEFYNLLAYDISEENQDDEQVFAEAKGLNAIPEKIFLEKRDWYYERWGNDLVKFEGIKLSENGNGDGDIVKPLKILEIKFD